MTEFTQVLRGDPFPRIALLDVKSSWFLVTATTSIGSVQSTMYSLLERKGGEIRTRLRTYDVN